MTSTILAPLIYRWASVSLQRIRRALVDLAVQLAFCALCLPVCVAMLLHDRWLCRSTAPAPRARRRS
jgi:hypothetical protein